MRRLSKSQIDVYEQCPRKWYFSYAYDPEGGIEAASSRGHELSVGVALHKGIECLFKGQSLDEARTAAKKEFIEDAGPVDNNDPYSQKLRVELLNTVDNMLRLWFYVRLPAILADYEYVDSELAVTVQLSDFISLYARPDAILRSREDGRYFNWSLKTEKTHGMIKHPRALIDSGGLTEAANMAMALGDGDLRNIGGTLMEYLVIGKLDRFDPIMWNPVVRGWRRPMDDGSYQYAWRWEFPNPDYDPNGDRSPKKNPKNISLKKKDGWERIEAKDYPGGPDAWVRALIAGKIYPRHLNPVDELILAPMPYVRTQTAITDFVEQTISEYTALDTKVARVHNGEATLNAAFPKRRYNCLRYGAEWRCPFWAICHEGLLRPLDNGFRRKQRRSLNENDADASTESEENEL